MMIDAADFDAVSFDVYGTILNWEPEIAGFLRDWASSGERTIDDADLLSAYDRIRQPLQDKRPALRYPEILTQTLQEMSDELGIDVSAKELERFSGIAATHKPFPDSVDALDALRGMGLTLAALSNIDDASFAKVTAAAEIEFDVVVTAERVGAYKPDHAHFWAALADIQALGIPMERVLHVAQSRRADIVVANAIGLTSVWVNRPGHIFGRVGRGAEEASPDYEVDSLAAVVRLLGST
ncbi:MAG: HAD family hydrolase [Pseudomonadota bacterium]